MQYTFDWSVIWRYRGTLLHGLALTLLLSLAGLAAALAIGMIAGAGGASRRPALRTAAILYVELARNVPLLVHIYFWYLALSALRLPAFWCGVLALAIYSGAYVAEIVRAGIQSVPSGQRAAALALGLSPAAALRSVIYPQALRITAPSLAGVFSQLIKDSSLASVISVAELTFAAGVIEGDTFRTFEAYITITLLYFLIVTAVSRAALLVFGRRGAEVDRRF
ncbi:MAG TPA: amino acid ABC transporter permease [Alphaproteobacteria bacterium]|nr:amino acid ABC transporter permease [Alphaproteobacteria bacterium]